MKDEKTPQTMIAEQPMKTKVKMKTKMKTQQTKAQKEKSRQIPLLLLTPFSMTLLDGRYGRVHVRV